MLLIAILLSTTILYLIQNKLFSKYWDKGLSVTITLSPKEIIEGNDAKLIEVIKKEGLLPLPSLAIKFRTSKYFDFFDQQNSITTDSYYRNDIISTMGNKKITRELDFIAKKRGYYSISSLDLVASNIFLNNDHVKVIDNFTSMYVYPKILPQKEIKIPFDKILGDYITKRSLNEDPFEFRGIRGYQPFDNFSSINWKASAKLNSLMINQHNFTTSLNVEIIYNADLLNSQFEDLGETTIRIIATLAKKITKTNIPFSFKSNAYDTITKKAITIPASTGSNQLRFINKALAKIDLSAATSDFINLLNTDTNSSALKIIISADYSSSVIDAYKSLKAKNSNVIFILPTKQNNEIINYKNQKDIFVWEVNCNDE